MLLPRKTKFRKHHRGHRRGESRGQTTVNFGDFGINTTYFDHGLDELLAAVRHYRPDLFEESGRL